MRNTSKIDLNKRDELSSSVASRDVEEEGLSQTAEGATSLRDLPLELRKEAASKPIYLTRYE